MDLHCCPETIKNNEFSESLTGFCSDGERVEVMVERLRQFKGQDEGLASPHDQPLHWDLIGAMFGVVGLTVQVDSDKHWKRQKDTNINKLNEVCV